MECITAIRLLMLSRGASTLEDKVFILRQVPNWSRLSKACNKLGVSLTNWIAAPGRMLILLTIYTLNCFIGLKEKLGCRIIQSQLMSRLAESSVARKMILTRRVADKENEGRTRERMGELCNSLLVAITATFARYAASICKLIEKPRRVSYARRLISGV